MFKKILLAADGSTHSLRASEKAIELAKYNRECSLEILYVVDGITAKTDVILNPDSIELEKKRREKLAFIEIKAKNHKIKYSVVFLHGDPAETIISYSNRNNFDILIIGSRGLNAMQEMVLGSVSHKVAKRVNCPVMIVK